MSAASDALLAVLTALGWVVVLPLGLRTLGAAAVPVPRSAAWPVAGAFGAASVLVPTGWAGVALALPAAVATAVLAVAGVRHGLRAVAATAAPRPRRAVAATAAPRPRRAATPTAAPRPDRADAPTAAPRPVRPRWTSLGPDLSIAAGLAFPVVGASALVAERGGWSLLGFSSGYLALTVPHMLFAGFGACLVAGLLARESQGSRLAAAAAWGVPAGVGLVLAGYLVSDVAELAGAVVLTVALWAALWAGTRGAGALRLTAALAGTAGMLLALWWAVGEAFAVPHPSIGWMLATHGVANALGVVLCSLLALRPGGPAQGPGPAHGAAPAEGAVPPQAGRAAVVPPFTYAEVGATAGPDLPPGYAHLRARHRLGPGGPDDLARVGEALLTWRVHAAARVRLATSGGVAAPGTRVTTLLGVGGLRLVEPCEVIWTERTDTRVAFGYGTLPGHVFAGEEAFAIERDDDGLWFAAVAFSRPVVWWVRLLRPGVPLFQHAYLAWLARGARVVLRETAAGVRR